ncbi:MAG: hypothetical protein KY455_07695 [Euryarchaeota archaeon]|nr:hypothetical protein [Euryarchaeota archaeon]
MKQGSAISGAPVTESAEEAVRIIQEAGVVGAGGAGFPAYVKYQDPVQLLVANGCESEPGYYCDKLLLRDEAPRFFDLFQWMADTFGIAHLLMAAEEVAEPYMQEWLKLSFRDERMSTVFIPPVYKLGEEKALIKHLFEEKIPKDHIPPQHGYLVNNVETLYNIHRAVTEKRPVTSKFLHLYGEGFDEVQALKAPIGTGLTDLMTLCDVDPADHGHCKVYDGGPLLARIVCDPYKGSGWTSVTKSTNAFLVTSPEKDKPRFKHYPSPDYKANTIDAPWAAKEIRDVTEDIDRVRIPLGDKCVDADETRVEEGDTVEEGDLIVAPAEEGMTVGTHASIPGKVTEVTDAYIEIERR